MLKKPSVKPRKYVTISYYGRVTVDVDQLLRDPKTIATLDRLQKRFGLKWLKNDPRTTKCHRRI